MAQTAVLTAAHCVVGAADRGGAQDNRIESVIVGNTTTSPRNSHTSAGYVSRVFPGPEVASADAGEDIALVFMDPMDGDQYELNDAFAFRPTLKLPTPAFPESIKSCGAGAVNSGFYDNAGGAGWDGSTFRSLALRHGATSSGDLGINACKSDPNVGGVFFELFKNGWTVCRGDSGGPLFHLSLVSASASVTTEGPQQTFRDVFGVLSSMGIGDPIGTCGPPTYVDVVDGYNYGSCSTDANCPHGGTCTGGVCNVEPLAKWIDDHMQDGAPWVSTSGNFTGHSALWLQKHGKTGQSWRGEVDYIGHCKNPFVTRADLDASGGVPTPEQVKKCVAIGGEDCDCDHWDNAHDNCPLTYNPDQSWTNETLQVDPNKNPIGDACRNCPCDPNNDEDGDGYCAVLCDWQVGKRSIDNCEHVKNPDQANCNADFEFAHQGDGIDILGDACDPVPCPLPNTSQSLTPTTTAPGCGSLANTCNVPNVISLCPSGCALNTDCTTCQCCGLSNHNAVLTATIGAHQRFPLTPQAVEVDVPPGNNGVAETTIRFCQSNADTNKGIAIDCGLPQVLNDNQLTQPEGPSTTSAPWHRITTHQGAPFNPNIFDPHFTTWTYGATVNSLDWVYLEDFNNWLANPNAPAIPGCATGTPPNANALPFTCLNGSWWTSGKTDVGKLIDTVGIVKVGNHVPITFDSSNPLSGSIADGIVAMKPASTVSWCPIPSPIIPISGTGKSGKSGALGYGPGKLVVLPRSLSSQLDIGLAGDARFLVASSSGNVVAALQSDGSAIAAENIGSADCGGAQVDGTLHTISFDAASAWISAVEPSAAIAGLDQDAVALNTDGTSIVGTARSQLTLSPAGLPMGLTQGAIIDPALGGASDPFVPAARDGYAAAFSRWAGGVFVAGGVARADGTTLHDVWFRGLAGRWTNVTPHAALGTSCPSCAPIQDLGAVQAITFSFDDNEMWILDQIAAAKRGTVLRLSHARPGGALHVVATWTRQAALEEYDFLSLDHDGGILVSRAHADGQGFFMARVQVDDDGTARAVSSYIDHDDKLLGPPFVSPVGYGFFVQHGQTKRIDRQRALLPLAHEKEMGALGDP